MHRPRPREVLLPGPLHLSASRTTPSRAPTSTRPSSNATRTWPVTAFTSAQRTPGSRPSRRFTPAASRWCFGPLPVMPRTSICACPCPLHTRRWERRGCRSSNALDSGAACWPTVSMSERLWWVSEPAVVTACSGSCAAVITSRPVRAAASATTRRGASAASRSPWPATIATDAAAAGTCRAAPAAPAATAAPRPASDATPRAAAGAAPSNPTGRIRWPSTIQRLPSIRPPHAQWCDRTGPAHVNDGPHREARDGHAADDPLQRW
jgi:hypothetical protein